MKVSSRLMPLLLLLLLMMMMMMKMIMMMMIMMVMVVMVLLLILQLRLPSPPLISTRRKLTHNILQSVKSPCLSAAPGDPAPANA